MRYQVPQFLDIEDKIIGPLTLRQFLIYMGAVLLLTPVFLYSDTSLFMTFALPVLGVAAAFAHLKFNTQGAVTFLFNAFRFYSKPRMYLWRRDPKAVPLAIRDEEWEEMIQNSAHAMEGARSLSAIARALETEGNVMRKDEDIADPFIEQAPVTPEEFMKTTKDDSEKE